MSKAHVTAEELQLYVMGALSADRLAPFELHINECQECARGLQKEAELEVSLWALGSDLGRRQEAQGARPALPALPALLARWWQGLAREGGARRASLIAVGMAAAAALLLLMRPARQQQAPPQLVAGGAHQAAAPAQEQEPWMADCPDQLSLRECLSAARRRGLLVPATVQPEGMPRYQVLTNPGRGGGGYGARPFVGETEW